MATIQDVMKYGFSPGYVASQSGLGLVLQDKQASGQRQLNSAAPGMRAGRKNEEQEKRGGGGGGGEGGKRRSMVTEEFTVTNHTKLDLIRGIVLSSFTFNRKREKN